MPPSPATRRRMLQAAGGSLTVVFGGCTSIQWDGIPGADTAIPTDPEERTPLPPDILNPTASVVRQPSDEEPALVEFGLENMISEDIAVRPGRGGGHALGYLDLFVPVDDQEGRIVFHPGPEEVVVHEELPEKPVNGCWRWPEEATRWTIDMQKFSKVEGGGVYTIRHELYYLGPEAKCFPVGDYQVEDFVVPVAYPPDSDGGFRLNLLFTLTAKASGEFSITVERR